MLSSNQFSRPVLVFMAPLGPIKCPLLPKSRRRSWAGLRNESSTAIPSAMHEWYEARTSSGRKTLASCSSLLSWHLRGVLCIVLHSSALGVAHTLNSDHAKKLRAPMRRTAARLMLLLRVTRAFQSSFAATTRRAVCRNAATMTNPLLIQEGLPKFKSIESKDIEPGIASVLTRSTAT